MVRFGYTVDPGHLKELHEVLARRYRNHGARIEEIWRSFDRDQRAKALYGNIVNLVLKDLTDQSFGWFGKVLKFIVDRTGTKLGFLYQDLVEQCLLDILEYCLQPKADLERNAKNKLSLSPKAPIIDCPSPEVRIQQRRQKQKTRPVQSSMYEISPATASPDQPERVEMGPIFRVKQDTAEVFSTLFCKSKASGAVSWFAFEAAMADLSFSVMPKFESVFTVFPPPDMGIERSVAVHRPHKSHIAGYLLLMFARRLQRVDGWGEQTFEVA